MPRRTRADSPPEIPRDDSWRRPEVLDQMEAYARRSAGWIRRDAKREQQENLDAYRNELTGIGDWNRDKTFGGSPNGPRFFVRLLPGIEHESRWRGSDLGGRIVETVPDEMMREGYEIQVQPDEDDANPKADFAPGGQAPPFAAPMPEGAAHPEGPPSAPLPDIDESGEELAEQVEAVLEEIGTDGAITDALCFRRAYGGGAILIGADDGTEDLAKPLDETRIKSVKWLNALQGGWDGEVVAWSWYRDPRSPKYGLPEVYMVRNLGVPIARIPAPGEPYIPDPLPAQSPNGAGPLIYWVHESRLLIFSAPAVSKRARVQMRGWGDSVFTRIDEVLSQYGQTWGGIANLMTDFAQGVLSIEGLAAKFATNDKKSQGMPLTTRAMQLQMARSIARMLLIDSKEKFSRETTPLTGIAEILQQFALRLAAAADMPVTLLMGQSPAGLNATGASDVRFFYDRIAARQKRDALPQLKRLIRLIMLSKDGPTGGVEPAKWGVEFRPLYQMTASEEADVRLKIAQVDQIYVNLGVLGATEVTASAFGSSKWSMERTLDLKGREEQAKLEEKDKQTRNKALLEQAKKQPAPDAVGDPPTNTPPAE